MIWPNKFGWQRQFGALFRAFVVFQSQLTLILISALLESRSLMFALLRNDFERSTTHCYSQR
jgi:hypothetical protein